MADNQLPVAVFSHATEHSHGKVVHTHEHVHTSDDPMNHDHSHVGYMFGVGYGKNTADLSQSSDTETPSIGSVNTDAGGQGNGTASINGTMSQ
jgi:hypothetical protein